MSNLNSLGRDLTNPRWMIAKAGMFMVAFAMCGVLLVLRGFDDPSAAADGGGTHSVATTLWIIVPYALGAWCACRAYYFGFYVITAYCDPQFRYAGVWSAIRWALGGNARRPTSE